jgi:transcriptional regulator with XRE-family HTH domain
MKRPEIIKHQVEMYEKIILNQVGVFVYNQRKQKNITIKDLNIMTGVGTAVISDLENQKSMPRVETLLRISEALDIPNTLLFEHMKLVTTAIGNGSRARADRISISNKYDQLATFVAGLDYSKEDVAEVVSYLKYLDYKKKAQQ